MLVDAFDFVRDSDDWLPTIFIGGVLSIFGVLILPGLIVQGYLVRVLRDAVEGESESPSFTRWGELLIDGVKAFLLSLAYSLVVVVPTVLFSLLVLGGAGMAGAGAGVGGDGGSFGLFAGLASLLFTGLVLVLSLVLAYVIPAAMTNFAVEGRLGAAFDFGTIRRVIFTSDYAVAWLVSILVGVLGGVVSLLVSATLVGILLVPFVLFYTQTATYYVYGRGFAEALNRDRVEYAAV